MAKKCLDCGRDNDDAALRCACGSSLPGGPAAEAVQAPAAAAPDAAQAPAAAAPDAGGTGGLPSKAPSFLLRKLLLALAAVVVGLLFAWRMQHWQVRPLYHALVGSAAFAIPLVLASWLLGPDTRRGVRPWRIFFVAWAILASPLFFTIVDGVVREGWPQGRFNRPIARLLIMDLTLVVPALIIGLLAALRLYRTAGVLAMAAGLAAAGDFVYLLRATKPFRGAPVRIFEVLDIVLACSRAGVYLAIPAGLALIVGGIWMLRAPSTRA